MAAPGGGGFVGDGPARRHIFLTGQPGVGKTTLLRTLVHRLACEYGGRLMLHGFYTEECRSPNGERVGFDVVGMDGRRAPLARAGAKAPGQPSVGKYAVDVPSFEALALPAMEPPPPPPGDGEGGGAVKRIFVVDEVGKMELLSRAFFPAVERLLNSAPLVLGTLPAARSGRPGIAQVPRWRRCGGGATCRSSRWRWARETCRRSRCTAMSPSPDFREGAQVYRHVKRLIEGEEH